VTVIAKLEASSIGPLLIALCTLLLPPSLPILCTRVRTAEVMYCAVRQSIFYNSSKASPSLQLAMG